MSARGVGRSGADTSAWAGGGWWFAGFLRVLGLVSLLPAAPFEVNLSVPLVFEYEEVLPQHGHTMGLTTTDIADFLDFLCTKANLHEIFFLLRPMLTDPKDEMLLELAVKARCQYIVTYNTRNFRGAEQFGTAVVTPKAFLEILEGLS